MPSLFEFCENKLGGEKERDRVGKSEKNGKNIR